MNESAQLVKELEASRRYFKKTLSVFGPEDEAYSPGAELYTVAGHVSHVADSVNWFIEGAFGEGWDLDFEASIDKAKGVTSLDEAKELLDRAFQEAISVVGEADDASLVESIPDTRIMEGAPRSAVVGGISEHTAHHRGALAVYARLIGKVPPMPYG